MKTTSSRFHAAPAPQLWASLPAQVFSMVRGEVVSEFVVVTFYLRWLPDVTFNTR